MKAIKLIALAAMCMAGSYALAQDLIVGMFYKLIS